MEIIKKGDSEGCEYVEGSFVANPIFYGSYTVLPRGVCGVLHEGSCCAVKEDVPRPSGCSGGCGVYFKVGYEM